MGASDAPPVGEKAPVCVAAATSAADLADASAVLIEAARWLEARGMPLWSFETLTADGLRPAFAAGELFVARRQDNGEAVGAMRLQEEDRIFWPEVPPGEALFLHKLAVRRAAAGCGVSRCMIRWAADEARRRGLRSLRLDCDGTRPALRTFYESAEFTFVDERLMRSWVAARFVLTIPQETPTTP